MDEVKIQSPLVLGIIERAASKLLSKKLGRQISLQLNMLEAEVSDATATAHLDLRVLMGKDELKKLLKELV